jgi:pSer/pThr/pTyr-binding forkhead associated (FHA) protein
MNVHLRVVEGKPLGVTIPLKGPEFLIGRDPSCQLRPKHESVDPRHCALSIVEGGVAVEDLGSEAGTLLNGRRLDPAQPTPARHGDRLRVGNLVFEVSIPGRWRSLDDDDAADPLVAIANRLLQQSLAAGGDPMRALGTSLRAEMLEGIPIVTIDLPRVIGEPALVTFRNDLRNLSERPNLTRLVLDFRKVHGFSVEAAQVLLAFLDRIETRGTVLKFSGLAPDILAMLDDAGVTARVGIEPDRRDAVWSGW